MIVRRCRGALCRALVLSFAFVSPSHAQTDPAGDEARLRHAFSFARPNQWVRVALVEGEPVEGEFRRMDEDAIVLLMADGSERTLATGDVAAVAFKDRSFWQGVLVGLPVGAVGATLVAIPMVLLLLAGGGLGYLAVGVLGAAVFGGIVGGAVGGAIPRWTQVYETGVLLERPGWAGPPLSAQGYAGIVSLHAGYAVSSDDGAPDGGGGGTGRFIVPLGRYVALGLELGIYGLGDGERMSEFSGLFRFSLPIERFQPYLQLGLGSYNFDFDPERYNEGAPEGNVIGDTGVGGQTTLGLAFFPRKTPFFLSSELTWHHGWFGGMQTSTEGVEYGRDLHVFGGNVAVSVGW